MSSAKARRYLDTVFALVMPRVCVALKLGCTYVGLKEVNEEEIGLVVLPNPARENIRFETSDKNPIESVYFYDMEGRLMKAHTNLNSNQVNIPRHNLNAGIYLAQVRTKDKVVTKQVVFQD